MHCSKNDEEREYPPWISSDEARNYSSFQECSHPSDLRYPYWEIFLIWRRLNRPIKELISSYILYSNPALIRIFACWVTHSLTQITWKRCEARLQSWWFDAWDGAWRRAPQWSAPEAGSCETTDCLKPRLIWRETYVTREARECGAWIIHFYVEDLHLLTN